MKKLYFYLGVVALFCSCNDILQDGNMDGLQSMPDNGKEESIEQQILHIIEGFNGGNDQSLQTRALGNNDEIEFTNIQRKDIVYEPSISAKMTNASIQYTDTVPVYYVEFRKNGTNGFSIVTTDYRFPGVFAYSENGCLADTVYNKGMALVLSQIPAYCQSIMEEHLNIVDKPQTRTAIDYIEIGDLLMGKYEEKRWINSEKEAILEIQTPQWVSKIEDKPDILKTKWHQEAPYNNLCPSTSCETHAYAGCVAIAIAQICAYYQQPNNYDWNLLTENPQIQDSETEAAQEVARLIRNIGEDVDMNYQCGGSGATPENARRQNKAKTVIPQANSVNARIAGNISFPAILLLRAKQKVRFFPVRSQKSKLQRPLSSLI